MIRYGCEEFCFFYAIALRGSWRGWVTSRAISTECFGVAMLIREGDNFLEVIALERITGNLPTLGDTRFEIRVQSFGFAGQGWTWIDALSLRSFAEQLRKLENQRQGKAELESMSPREFWLNISSTDSLGHMALFGRLCQFEVGSKCEHLLDFGFSFDPSILPSIIKDFQTIVSGL